MHDDSRMAIGSLEGARNDLRTGGMRGRVLVVDDDASIVRIIRRFLRDHDVATASDGRSALAILETTTDFDLVLCDVVMPVMGGVEFWSEVAARHPSLLERVVLMTGGARSAADEMFLASGVVRVLRKPFSFDVLHEILAARIEARVG